MSKPSRPFRTGCTSYVYPMDILPNVERMAGLVDDIELVLFEGADFSNLPDPAVVEALAGLADRHGLTYTVHFPIDSRAAARDREERERFCRSALHIGRLCAPLNPHSWVLHFEGLEPQAAGGYEPAEIRRWREAAGETGRRLLDSGLFEPRRVSVENLGYPAEWNLEPIERLGFSVCQDLGHLWKREPDGWLPVVLDLLPRTRVIHLHGLRDGQDHLSLKRMDRAPLQTLCERVLPGYREVLTLEVFSREDTFESLELLDELWSARP